MTTFIWPDAWRGKPLCAALSPEWFERRKTMLTASEVPAAMGLTKWGGPLTLWLQKTGRSPDTLETSAMKAGTHFEAAAADFLFDHMRGAGIAVFDPLRVGALAVCDEYPFIGATPDYAALIDGEVRPFECKWFNGFRQDEFVEFLPEQYRVQVNVQLLVTGARVGYLGIVFGGFKPEVYTVERDEDLIERIIMTAEAFKACLDNDEAPTPTAADIEVLSDGLDVPVPLDGEAEDYAEAYLAANRKIAAENRVKAHAKAQLLAFMGKAQSASVGRFTIKSGAKFTVQESRNG